MNFFLFYKTSTIETNEFLKQNLNFWHLSLDNMPYNYSLELEEFFNCDKTLLDTFNMKSVEEKNLKKRNVIKRLCEQIKTTNVLTKIINLEDFIQYKNKLYVVRELDAYVDSLVEVYNVNLKNNNNWRYDKILNFCKIKYRTNDIKEAFYLSSKDEYEKIKNKCYNEEIELITLKKNERYFI